MRGINLINIPASNAPVWSLNSGFISVNFWKVLKLSKSFFTSVAIKPFRKQKRKRYNGWSETRWRLTRVVDVGLLKERNTHKGINKRFKDPWTRMNIGRSFGARKLIPIKKEKLIHLICRRRGDLIKMATPISCFNTGRQQLLQKNNYKQSPI